MHFTPSRMPSSFPARALRVVSAFVVCAFATASRAAVSQGFRVPDGFEVSLYAGDELAHDIFSMTIDSKGRVVVAGAGYVKILHETKGTGRADKATVFLNGPKSGAHGMYFEGNDLICDGDNGVRRWFDRDGDGVADGDGEQWIRTERDGEHSANGIIKGPDGWYYLICGNDAGVSSSHASLPGSPVKQPNAGGVIRIAPDGKGSEVLAHGFRNPYNIDFNPYGQLFTYDADGERDHLLPWYAGTRIFDIATGGHHGWILRGWQHAWNRPEIWFDNVERLWEVGRGSPTGVTVYRHRAFPQHYRNGLFAVCWTYGRIYFFPLNRRGSTYSTQMEIFMETAGDVGFAPTGIAVGPDGDLFVSIGGRGTVGSVFRVHYTGQLPPEPPLNSLVRQVLAAPQPLAAWSRAQWVPRAKELGRGAFEQATLDAALLSLERIRALEVLVEVFNGVTPLLAAQVADGRDAELTARAVWAVSRGVDSPDARAFLAMMTRRDDPRIARAAWEAVLSLPTDVAAPTQPDWYRGLNSDYRRVREATVLAARSRGMQSFAAAPHPAQPTERQRLGVLNIFGPDRPGVPGWLEQYFNTCVFVFGRSSEEHARISAVRLLQIGLGDVKIVQDQPDTHDGFIGARTDDVPATLRRHVVERLGPAFPTGHHELDRELGRLLAMLSADTPGLLEHVTTRWDSTTSVEDDIHFLMVASRLPAPRSPEARHRIAEGIARLHLKLLAAHMEPSRFWPARVADMFARLLQRDPLLANALVESAHFGLPDHALFAQRFSDDDKPAAARRLLHSHVAVSGQQPPPWTPELVEFLAVLPDEELFPALRTAWTNATLQDSITLVLARAPSSDDREKFLAALNSFQPNVAERAAKVLASLPDFPSPKEMGSAVASLRRHCAQAKDKPVREALAALLASWSGQKFAVTETGDLMKSYAPWFDWFAAAHPQEAKQILGGDEDVAAWLKRLTAINWDAGDTTRGQLVFEQRMCARCHTSSTRIGPDLVGIAARLSREDLFIAILDPSRDISPAYLPKVYVTKSGGSYLGFVVYESPTAKLIQTGPDTTVRLTGDEVVEVRDERISLMPNSLLAGLRDEDAADLYAFLKTIKKK